jgi:hypothetical protein
VRRILVVLTLLAAVSCSKPPAQKPASLFAPAAEKLGVAQAADLKAKYETAYQQYLKETGAKDEVELGRKLGEQHLQHYAAALTLSEAEEKALRAGTFNDVENRKKMNDLISKFVEGRGSASMIGRLIIQKTQAGPEWNTGLQLELALRILQSELGSSK